MKKVDGQPPPLRVEARLRNNRLYRRIFQEFRSVNEFCCKTGEHPSEVGRLLNLKMSPLRIHGEWIVSAQRIAKYFKELPEDLFPLEVYTVPETVAVAEIDVPEMPYFAEWSRRELADPLERVIEEEQKEDVMKMLTLVTPRERLVIKARFGLGVPQMSLEKVGEALGVSQERVRQIEHKVLRRMTLAAAERDGRYKRKGANEQG